VLAAEPGVARVLALQRAIGNRATGRLLARDGPTADAPLSDSLFDPIASRPGAGFGLGPLPGLRYVPPPPLSPLIDAAIRQYISEHKFQVQQGLLDGTTSMPEIVADIRSNCLPAQQATPDQIADIVQQEWGGVKIPQSRKNMTVAGLESQLAARIANALKAVPTSVKFRIGPTSIELGIDGAQISAKVGKATITGQASPTGDSFGLTTKVGDTEFAAKIEKDGSTYSKWSLALKIPVIGKPVDAVPDPAALTALVTPAEAAVGRAVAKIAAGAKPTDSAVTDEFKNIKPAIDALTTATAERKGPSVSISGGVSGDSKGWMAGITLVVTF
jgi:hypothetical protein